MLERLFVYIHICMNRRLYEWRVILRLENFLFDFQFKLSPDHLNYFLLSDRFDLYCVT